MPVISQRGLGSLNTGGAAALIVFEVLVLVAVLYIVWAIYRAVRKQRSNPTETPPNVDDSRPPLTHNIDLHRSATSSSESNSCGCASSRTHTELSSEHKSCVSFPSTRAPSAVLMLKDSAVPFMRQVARPKPTLPPIHIPTVPMSTDATSPVVVLATPISAASSVSAYSQSTMCYSQWQRLSTSSRFEAPSGSTHLSRHIPLPSYSSFLHWQSSIATDSDTPALAHPLTPQSQENSHPVRRPLPVLPSLESGPPPLPDLQTLSIQSSLEARPSPLVTLAPTQSVVDHTYTKRASTCTVLSLASVYSQCTIAAPSLPSSDHEPSSIPPLPPLPPFRPLPPIPEHVLRRVEQQQREEAAPGLSRAPTKVIANLVKVRARRARLQARVSGAWDRDREAALQRKVSRIERKGSIKSVMTVVDVDRDPEDKVR